MFKFILLFYILFGCIYCDIESNDPIFVGGFFETIGSPQNLHSFGEYYPDSGDWINVKDSAIMSTGTADAITIIESGSEEGSIIVGGVFNYLNHTSNAISFGNIAYYNQTSKLWQSLGIGCNGPITALKVIQIQSESCTLENPCYTIVVAGRFDACIQNDQERTTVSYPGGLAFFDLIQSSWYKPVNQSLPEDLIISYITFSGDFGYLYIVGDHFNDLFSTGYAYRTPIIVQDGQLSSLEWEELVKTLSTSEGIFNTIVPVNSTNFYIGGLYDTLVLPSGDQISASNIAFYNGTQFHNLQGGVNGEIVSATLVSYNNTHLLYVAGNFTKIGILYLQTANYIACWNLQFWEALGDGIELNSDYTSIIGAPLLRLGNYKTSVIVGGSIKKAGNITVNNVAIWDGDEWSSLGDDSDFEHYRMYPFVVDSSGKVYFAAQGLQNTFFEDIIINGYPLVENLMVDYNITKSQWGDYIYNELLLDGIVFDMEFYNDTTLIIGGGFRKAGNITNLNNLVLLDYPNMNWSPFDGGIYGVVTSLAVVNKDVFVGGIFQYIGDATKYASVAKYSSSEGWTNVGSGIPKADPSQFSDRPIVYDIEYSLDTNMLYAGGSFEMALDVNNELKNVTSLVAWDISQQEWVAVQNEISGIICDLSIFDNSLYLGGQFVIEKNNDTYNLALLDITTNSNIGIWKEIISPCSVEYAECETQVILDIAINPHVPYGNNTGSPIYIGGVFSNIQGNVVNGLARLVEYEWVAFGSGVTGGRFPFVVAIELSSDYTTLYIGGSFTSANSVPVNDIVAWSLSSTSFSALSPIEGWEGLVLDILPIPSNVSISTYSEDSNNTEKMSRLSIGLIIALSVLVICLLLIIMLIGITLLKYKKPKEHKRIPDYDNESINNSETDSWDDYYSYEWEISYNLLEIAEAVGKGRNGVIHSATYKGQYVAVKIFNNEISAAYYIKDSVCKYASKMRALQHPNIVHIIGASADPLCLVTEYAEMGCLSDIIRISPSKLTCLRIKSIMLEIARGMSFLHGQEPSILHQHFTTNNIIITDIWSAKICDIGLTGVLKESGEYKVSISKRWSAPEILEGNTYTKKSDVYSFGLIMYHTLCKTVPYSIEERDKTLSLSQFIISGGRPTIEKISSFPYQFVDLMQTCWSNNPDDRPSFTQILTRLNEISDADLEPLY